MVNKILENFHTHTGMGVSPSHTSKPVSKNLGVQQNALSVNAYKHGDNSDSGKYLLPLSLITGGGLLLYYGLKRPNKVSLFNKHVQNRLIQMEVEISSFEKQTKNTIAGCFSEASEYIRAYKQNNNIVPSEFSSNIKNLNNSKQVVDAQDLAFEAITNTDREYFRPGPSDIGNFSVKMDEIKRNVLSQVDRNKENTRLLFEDFTHLPKFENGKHSDLIETSESQLVTTAASYLGQLEKIKLGEVRKAVTDSYNEMAQVIFQNRQLRYEAKKQVVDNAFEQLRFLLKLPEDFQPSYDKIATLGNFAKLTPEELKPQVLPQNLSKLYEHNVFFDAVKMQDFNNVTEDDLTRIFYTSFYNNNLNDLGFLIDRLRLRQVVSAVESPKDSKAYDVVIAKLEFLQNKLADFGKDELIKKCSKDFENMNVEQRKAALYYVSTVSRRLGFDSIELMDKYMAKNSPAYQGLNIREYMDVFKSSPDLYFY